MLPFCNKIIRYQFNNSIKHSDILKLFPVYFFIWLSFVSCGKKNPTNPPQWKKEANAATINLSAQKQIIRGFGAANIVYWTPDLTSGEINKAFGTGKGQLGFSILRIQIPPQKDQFKRDVPTAKKAYSMGVKIIASPWTPPPSMKTNDNKVGGRLKKGKYSDYAAYLQSFNTYMQNNGVPLYAVSVQNEPDISVNYASCHWNASEMVQFMKNNAQTIDTRVIAPESYDFNKAISDSILENPAAAKNLDIVGGHIYGGGLKPYPLAKRKGKEVWMTEHLDTTTTYKADLKTGKEIHDCLTYAHFNAYVWWYIKRFYGPMDKNGNITKRGYIMSNYARFIRPGYHRMEATSNPQPNVYVGAYKGDNKLVIIAINMSSTYKKQQFILSNSTITSLTPYVTTSSMNVSEKKSVSVLTDHSSYSYNLPPQSIITFLGK